MTCARFHRCSPASAHMLSAAVGCTLGGVAVHHLGPRRVLLLQALPTIAGWLMMTLATSYPLLLTGRFLVGFFTGMSLGAGQVRGGFFWLRAIWENGEKWDAGEPRHFDFCFQIVSAPWLTKNIPTYKFSCSILFIYRVFHSRVTDFVEFSWG